MTDPVLDAMRAYETSVAPAYEVIRRARSRLVAALADIDDMVVVDPGAIARFVATADPTEPNGAEMAIEQPGQGQEQQPVDTPGPVSSLFDPPSGGEVHPAPVAARTAVIPPAPAPTAAEDKHECPICHIALPSQRGVKVHIGILHKGEQPASEAPVPLRAKGDRPEHFCYSCNAGFPSGAELAEHRRTPQHRRAMGAP